VVPGGVDPSGTHRVVPSLLWHIERLARHHDMTVVATAQFDEDREYRFLGANVRCLGRAVHGSQDLRLARLLGALEPDLIHLHWVDRGLAVWWASRWLGCPFIVTLMGGELVHLPEIAYGGNRTAFSRARLRVLLGGAAAVTCTDRDTAARLTALGVEPTMVLLGADRSAFPTRQGEPPGPPWQLLQVGSLNAVKDQRTLLVAFARLREEGMDARLTFVGEDILGGEAVRLAAALGVEPWVRFEGYVPWTAMAHHYHRAHLLVVSSRHETGPMVALEAAASGVAVVGTAVGRLKDWAADGVLPVARPGDPEALAGVIRALLVDGDRRARVAAALGEIAREHDADDTARAFDELYGRVLPSSRAKRGPAAASAAVPPRTQ
jgi:glycosyltransferase involved in cell wall biosynthesis